MASVEASWIVIAPEKQAIAQKNRFRAAASALVYRRFLHQPVRHLLLLVQRSGWVQSLHRALRSARVQREADIEVLREAKPRIIPDNRPQFIARDFKEFIRFSGMTHVRTSPLPDHSIRSQKFSIIHMFELLALVWIAM